MSAAIWLLVEHFELLLFRQNSNGTNYSVELLYNDNVYFRSDISQQHHTETSRAPVTFHLSPLETISTSSWASLYHHLPVLSMFSHFSCQFVFSHIFSVVVCPSQSRSPSSSLPWYDHVHNFS